MRHRVVLGILALVNLAVPAHAFDCAGSPPSRASSTYWDYLAVCGCSGVDPVSQASVDYQRWLTSCAASLAEAQQAQAVARAFLEVAPSAAEVEAAASAGAVAQSAACARATTRAADSDSSVSQDGAKNVEGPSTSQGAKQGRTSAPAGQASVAARTPTVKSRSREARPNRP